MSRNLSGLFASTQLVAPEQTTISGALFVTVKLNHLCVCFAAAIIAMSFRLQLTPVFPLMQPKVQEREQRRIDHMAKLVKFLRENGLEGLKPLNVAISRHKGFFCFFRKIFHNLTLLLLP